MMFVRIIFSGRPLKESVSSTRQSPSGMLRNSSSARSGLRSS